jgi:tetratricopeptide (TPR) repeat protein
VKAFYVLITFLPMCACGAAGWEWLAKIFGRLRPILYVAMCVWAINAYASFWIRSGSAATHALRGNYLSNEGHSREAIAELNEALRIDPHCALARRFLATELARTDVDAAWQETKKLLADDPDNAPGLVQAALLLAQNGQMNDALQKAASAVEAAPDYALGYEEMSLWYAQSGKYREAERAAREGLRITPLSPDMHFRLGSALSNLGEDADAARHFQIACDLKSNWPEAHFQLGLSFKKLNRWNAAANEFSAACKLLPTNADYQAHLREAIQHAEKTGAQAVPGQSK